MSWEFYTLIAIVWFQLNSNSAEICTWWFCVDFRLPALIQMGCLATANNSHCEHKLIFQRSKELCVSLDISPLGFIGCRCSDVIDWSNSAQSDPITPSRLISSFIISTAFMTRSCNRYVRTACFCGISMGARTMVSSCILLSFIRKCTRFSCVTRLPGNLL